ncbi:MAG: NADH-quinone oxidoreductase subunit M [Candidatus Micrarchaeaceae archaeon]
MFPFIIAMFVILAFSLAIIAIFKDRFSYYIAAASSSIILILNAAIDIEAYTNGWPSLSAYLYLPFLSSNLTFTFNPTSAILVTMSSIVIFVSVIADIKNLQKKGMAFLVMLFEFATIGLFTSASLLSFYIFWDIGVAASFFMINNFGGPIRHKAAMKFLIYSFAASALLLFGILLIYFLPSVHTFNIGSIVATQIPDSVQTIIFAVLLSAFMIKASIFPLHSWMPDAYSEAPTSGSMLLAGILSKYGMYGILLLFIMLPISAKLSFYIMCIAFISTFYSAFVMIQQRDIKRMLGFMSMAELSFLLIGISSANPIGIFGGTFGLLSHGFSIALLFLVAGSMEYIFSSRNIAFLKGVIKSSVSTFYSFIIGIFASLGLPLTTAFVADLLVSIGAFKAFGFIALLPLLAFVLIAAYAYYVIEIISYTKSVNESNFLIGKTYKFGYAVLILCIFIFGLMPFIFTWMIS